MNELKPEDVMRALEWCSDLRLCVDCPMRAEGYFSHSGNACRQALMKAALALLRECKVKIEVLEEVKNQLEIDTCNANMNLAHAQAEIERLTKELDGQFEKWKILADKTERHYGELYQEAKQVVRAEAITEFAERLKKYYDALKSCLVSYHIDQIAKEMREKT